MSTTTASWLNDGAVADDGIDYYLYAMEIRDDLGRKFVEEDLQDRHYGLLLMGAAQEYLKVSANASFDFLRDIAQRYAKKGYVSDRQAAGVLNCLVADIQRQNRQKAEREAVQAAPQVAQVETQATAIQTEGIEGTYTVVFNGDSDDYTTIKISKWKEGRDGGKIRWISLLAGPNNEGDYQWIARMDAQGGLIYRHKDNSRLKVAIATVVGDKEARTAAREAFALASNACSKCGRKLTVPASLYRGVGPECAKSAL